MVKRKRIDVELKEENNVDYVYSVEVGENDNHIKIFVENHSEYSIFINKAAWREINKVVEELFFEQI